MSQNATRWSQGLSTSSTRVERTVSTSLRIAYLLTAIIIPLAFIASLGGLFIPGLYRDTPQIVPTMQGQDAVTVLVMPILLVSLLAARRGSTRGTLIWIGLLGYVFYTYTGAAFGYTYNSFLLLYIALFALSVAALIAAVSSLDRADIQRKFDQAVPRIPIVIFMALIALMLGLRELGENVQFLTTGKIPEAVIRAGGVTFFPYVLDLGVIMPLVVLSAILLWRRNSWGYLLSGYILIKSGSMGLALFAADWFLLRAGLPADDLMGAYLVLALGGLGLSVWLFRHCRG